MTLAIDFDGVIHAYDKGWHDGSIYGELHEGALKGLISLLTAEPVFILTARNPRHVAKWLERQAEEAGWLLETTTRLPRKTGKGLKRGRFWNTRHVLLVTNTKLAARVYVDDRAYRFSDWATTMSYLLPLEDLSG